MYSHEHINWTWEKMSFKIQEKHEKMKLDLYHYVSAVSHNFAKSFISSSGIVSIVLFWPDFYVCSLEISTYSMSATSNNRFSYFFSDSLIAVLSLTYQNLSTTLNKRFKTGILVLILISEERNLAFNHFVWYFL